MSKLKAWLRPNLLTKEDKTDFTALPVTNGSITLAGIVQKLKAEGMEIKAETAIDIISRFNRKAAELVLDGYNVNTGLVYMRPAIKGTFRDKTWNPEAHAVYVAINQSADLRKAVADTKVEILGEQSDPLAVFSITDKATGKTDGSLTKGKNAEIKGAYIKIAGDNAANGITFRNTDTRDETKLTTDNIVLNEPSRLLILVPGNLQAGTYEVGITTQFTSGSILLKSPRTVLADMVVSIV